MYTYQSDDLLLAGRSSLYGCLKGKILPNMINGLLDTKRNTTPASFAILLTLLANAHRQNWPPRVSITTGAILDSLGAPRLCHNNSRHDHYYRLVRRTLMELYRVGAVTETSLFREQRLAFGVGDECSWLVGTNKRLRKFTYALSSETECWFKARAENLLPHFHGGVLRLLWGRGNEIISKLYLSALNAGAEGCAYNERVLVTNLLGYSKKHISRYRPRITESFMVLEQMGFITRESVDLPPRKGGIFHKWRLSGAPSCGSCKIENAPSGEVLRLALSQRIDLGLRTRFA